MKVVILAGGLGQRLWPLSREKTPKHIQPLLGRLTLLQQTVARLRKRFKPSDIFIVAGKKHKFRIVAQLPGFPASNLLIEPARRNTAAATGLAAYTIAKTNPGEIFVSIASDHYIENQVKFLQNLRIMERVIKKDPLASVVMGIKPAYPETGYGYIQTAGEVKFAPGLKVLKVKKFIEKPGLREASRLVKLKNIFWNPSYFAWRADRLMALYGQYLPEVHKHLLSTVNGNTEAFKRIRPVAIDYGLMEKLTSHFYMVPGGFVWADVGHWASVKEILAKKSKDNVALGPHHLHDTTDTLIYNYTDNIVATVGVDGLLIVQTPGGTLVCRKDRAQDVKRAVEAMSLKKNLKKYL